jgi:predicted component of type VI protein secretion system
MNRTILLRHLSNSSLAGQSREFRQERIRLGRKSDNDVVFNPEQDRLVSGHHCEILAEGDDLFVIDPGSTNGTYVNGQRVQGKLQVSERDQIMLGEKGPTFAVGYAGADASGPRTIMGTVPAVGLAPAAASGLLDAAAADLYGGGNKGAAATAVAPPRVDYSLDVNVPVGARPAGATSPGAATGASGIHRNPSRISQGQKTHIGFQTLMLELDKATKRERKRVFVLAAPIVAVLLGGIALAWHLTRDSAGAGASTTVTALSPSPLPAPATPDWHSILEPRSRSVYVVVNRKQGRGDNGVGTAWSVKPGFLATNAHVAQAFLDLGEGEYLVARSNSDHPKDLKITAVELHPGYREFNRMSKVHFPLNPGDGKKILYATPFDVALMSIAEADVAQQAAVGSPLELADNATLMNITEATEIAYAGYPMDDAIGGGLNLESPRPQQFLGTLTRKTDPFMGNTSNEKANILQYTMPVQGGASGSPVFDRQGRVIGLISGNDHAFPVPGVRIAISGKAYGPRADAVRDLLDKTAEAKIAPLIPEWRSFLRSRYNEAKEAKLYDALPRAYAVNSIEVVKPANLPGGRIDRVVAEQEVTLSTSGDAGKKELKYEVAEAGYYIVVVTTKDPDMAPEVRVPDVEAKLVTEGHSPKKLLNIREKRLGMGMPITATFAARLAPGETLRYTVAGVARDPATTATMKVQIWRATP